jgi:hypothetical protein
MVLLAASVGCSPTVTVINDLHVDPETRRVTVYARLMLRGEIISPPQVGPGECTESRGDTVCFHPNAVYLNGSGEELTEADGSGEWWVKHSWIVDGEGYYNCELRPQESYDDCLDVAGVMLDDGLTLQIGGTTEEGEFFNRRRPLFDTSPVTYEVVRFEPNESDPDGEPQEGFTLKFACADEVSAFDGRVRSCPEAGPSGDGDPLLLHEGYWVVELDPSEF